jgi:hypothetical protein
VKVRKDMSYVEWEEDIKKVVLRRRKKKKMRENEIKNFKKEK